MNAYGTIEIVYSGIVFSINNMHKYIIFGEINKLFNGLHFLKAHPLISIIFEWKNICFNEE